MHIMDKIMCAFYALILAMTAAVIIRQGQLMVETAEAEADAAYAAVIGGAR